MKQPHLKLNNGLTIPQFGLGTWKSAPGEVIQAVEDAIDIGYRHLDCAFIYKNEKEVGEGLRNRIIAGVVRREDVFITSKLWTTFHSAPLVEKACRLTLENLGVDYLDLYLIHSPIGFQEGGDVYPVDDKGKVIFSDVDYIETWKAMEELVTKGLCRSIGVSNFNKKQIERILAIAKIVPVTNQVECHPYLSQEKLSAFCASKDILITAYSPLGSPDRPWAGDGDVPVLMEDPKFKELAVKYKKSVAQILMRYQIQRGHVVIPKSVSKIRIKENFEVLNFEMEKKDVEVLTEMNRNFRYFTGRGFEGHPYHPYENDEY